ncbi:MAG: DNA-binding response regulator [Nitrospiraceae bacterium]
MGSGRANILLVTSDEGFARSVEKHLQQNGYDVTQARGAESAVAAAHCVLPALVLLDRRQPVIGQLRSAPVLRTVPFISIQPPGTDCSDEQCVEDLERGADAVICKQGSRELVARVRAVLRREQLRMTPRSRYTVGGLQMDLDRYEVRVSGRHVELTPKEFQILKELMLQPSRVFSRDELLTKVWGEESVLEEHTLDVHIHSIRQKIEPDPSRPRFIVTIRGVGYKLRSEP